MTRYHTIKNIQQEKEYLDRQAFFISIFVLLLSLVLIARLIQLQILEQRKYQTLSKQNQMTVLPIKPNRGLIYDRNHFLLADNVPVYSLEVIPEQVPHLNQTLARLRKIIALNSDELITFKKLVKQHRPFDPIPLKIELSEKEIATFAVNKFNYPGIDISARLIRHYPYGPAFSHVLGYVSQISPKELETLDSNSYATQFIGKLGIEKFYEPVLHGIFGYQTLETNASGRIIRDIDKKIPHSGENLHLTIDARLQKKADELLKNQRGTLIALSPKTGEVLAMVSAPNYDPNRFVRGISAKDFQTLQRSQEKPLFNRTIRGQYPLASTIKPFMALMALENDVFSENDKIWDPGWFKIPNSSHAYRDLKRSGHGWVNLKRSIIESCNVYYLHVANTLGIDQINTGLKEFGFGQKIGIDISDELPGLIADPHWKKQAKHESWFPGDTLNSGIGQGYTLVTPLQLAYATSIIANRGTKIQPHLVKQVGTHTTEQKTLPPLNYQNVTHWQTVIDAMKAVILNSEGTGYRFGRHPAYTVAAKTGTAQVYSMDQYDFEKDAIPNNLRDHSLFIAFAPIKDPKIALSVIIENNRIAPKIARQFMDYYLVQLHGKPDWSKS